MWVNKPLSVNTAQLTTKENKYKCCIIYMYVVRVIIIKKIIVHTALAHIHTHTSKHTHSHPQIYESQLTNQKRTAKHKMKMNEKERKKQKKYESKIKSGTIHYIIHTIWTYPSYLRQNWSWLASAKLIRRNIYSALFCSPASGSVKHKMKMNRIVCGGGG